MSQYVQHHKTFLLTSLGLKDKIHPKNKKKHSETYPICFTRCGCLHMFFQCNLPPPKRFVLPCEVRARDLSLEKLDAAFIALTSAAEARERQQVALGLVTRDQEGWAP